MHPLECWFPRRSRLGTIGPRANEAARRLLLSSVGIAVLLVMVAVGTLIFRAQWGPFGYFLILGAAASFWTAAFFGLFHALVRNRNQAGAFAAPIILAFSLFGGSMMNVEAMGAMGGPAGGGMHQQGMPHGAQGMPSGQR